MERSLSPDSSGIDVEILQFGCALKLTGIVFTNIPVLTMQNQAFTHFPPACVGTSPWCRGEHSF